ncbi:MAG: 6-carboxytetrahydropterin synthase [Ornithinimicrobium sp.]
MFTVNVRNHMMVAHSLPDPYFGPAQSLHGVTYVVDVALRAPTLNRHGVVLDIGVASSALAEIVADLTYRNLDDHPAFQGVMSTTEVLAQHVAEAMLLSVTRADEDLRTTLAEIEVRLREHPDAWAGYTLMVEPRADT